MGDQKTPTDQPTGETPTSAEPTNQNPGARETPPWGDDFTPERAWATIQNLRKYEDEAKDLRKRQEDREAEQRRAEEAALAEQQKFEELAEKRLGEVNDLRPRAEQAERYEAALRRYLEVEREGLPDHIITLLDPMAVDEQLAYIAQNREALKPQQDGSAKPGVPPTPQGKSAPVTSADIRDRYLKQAGVIDEKS